MKSWYFIHIYIYIYIYIYMFLNNNSLLFFYIQRDEFVASNKNNI
ncbi:MAG: hypothetical protein N7Q72_03715 [Spiroplasma sp. Tabriz.8]|nr:hypothetical protein [Spiroplasma sp. Tabriz.8]